MDKDILFLQINLSTKIDDDQRAELLNAHKEWQAAEQDLSYKIAKTQLKMRSPEEKLNPNETDEELETNKEKHSVEAAKEILFAEQKKLDLLSLIEKLKFQEKPTNEKVNKNDMSIEQVQSREKEAALKRSVEGFIAKPTETNFLSLQGVVKEKYGDRSHRNPDVFNYLKKILLTVRAETPPYQEYSLAERRVLLEAALREWMYDSRNVRKESFKDMLNAVITNSDLKKFIDHFSPQEGVDAKSLFELNEHLVRFYQAVQAKKSEGPVPQDKTLGSVLSEIAREEDKVINEHKDAAEADTVARGKAARIKVGPKVDEVKREVEKAAKALKLAQTKSGGLVFNKLVDCLQHIVKKNKASWADSGNPHWVAMLERQQEQQRYLMILPTMLGRIIESKVPPVYIKGNEKRFSQFCVFLTGLNDPNNRGEGDERLKKKMKKGLKDLGVYLADIELNELFKKCCEFPKNPKEREARLGELMSCLIMLNQASERPSELIRRIQGCVDMLAINLPMKELVQLFASYPNSNWQNSLQPENPLSPLILCVSKILENKGLTEGELKKELEDCLLNLLPNAFKTLSADGAVILADNTIVNTLLDQIRRAAQNTNAQTEGASVSAVDIPSETRRDSLSSRGTEPASPVSTSDLTASSPPSPATLPVSRVSRSSVHSLESLTSGSSSPVPDESPRASISRKGEGIISVLKMHRESMSVSEKGVRDKKGEEQDVQKGESYKPRGS